MIESLQKQADEEILPKRVNGDLLNYYGIVPKEEKQKNKTNFTVSSKA